MGIWQLRVKEQRVVEDPSCLFLEMKKGNTT